MQTNRSALAEMPPVLLVLFSLILLLTGCASLRPWAGPAEAPTVSLADMELQGIKGLETIFLLRLRVMNPNDDPLELHGLNCTLKVNGKSFAKGISNEQSTVPASGTTTVPVTVYTTMLDIAGTVIELLQDDVQHSGPPVQPAQYELSGNLRLGNQDGHNRSLPFTLQGSLPPEQ